MDYPIDIVRSNRRKRTVSATLTGGRIRVLVPAGLEHEEEKRLVADVAAKVRSKSTSMDIDLTKRAGILAARYHLPKPVSIEWSQRQNKRWGSCTNSEGTVRISARLAAVPPWVLDSVIVHELAHLAEPSHGERFKELVARYELTERATGYLMAIDHGNARTV